MSAQSSSHPAVDPWASAAQSHLWGIVLGGAERRPLARAARASRHRAHALSARGRMRETIDRAARLIPPERLFAVLARDHSAYYDGELADFAATQRVIQPVYRGTAPEILLSALKIVRQDPHAIVAVLPARVGGHYDARFMSCIARAARAVTTRPDVTIVIGGYPVTADVGCPWLEPGEPIEGLEPFAVRTVRRFLSQPSAADVAALYDGEGLIDTQVSVAAARALLALGERFAPDVLEALEPLRGAFGAPEERLLCDAVWEGMPYADISVARGAVGVLPLGHALARDWRRSAAQALAS